MSTFILVVYILTNNPFHKLDAVPTIEFKSEEKCKAFIVDIQKVKEVKTTFACIEKK